MSAGDYVRAQRARTLMRAEWTRLLDQVDVIHAQALQLSLRTELDVWRYQIAQQAPRRLLVRLVARPDCEREATASRVTERFLEVLPEGVEVSIEFVTDLPRTPSGKVQPVVALSQPAGGEA